MRFRNENDAYGPLIRGAFKQRWVLYRIADGSWGKKPFDIGGCDHNGRAVAIEVKAVRGDSWPSRPPPVHLARSHQLAWLEAIATVGGRAYFALADADGCVMVPVGPNWREGIVSATFEFGLTWDDESGSTGWPD